MFKQFIYWIIIGALFCVASYVPVDNNYISGALSEIPAPKTVNVFMSLGLIAILLVLLLICVRPIISGDYTVTAGRRVIQLSNDLLCASSGTMGFMFGIGIFGYNIFPSLGVGCVAYFTFGLLFIVFDRISEQLRHAVEKQSVKKGQLWLVPIIVAGIIFCNYMVLTNWRLA